MKTPKYRTSPDPDRATLPTGIPHIIGNEAAERFSFYGMKGILAVFIVSYLHLMNDSPTRPATEAAAAEAVHIFNGWVYLTPFLGALISDIFFGKYRTIITLSLVYCMGHACLAFMGVQGDAKIWLMLGLALICLGSGGIKPCVSAHVGDQFGQGNSHLLSKIFNWFYFSINLGAFISMLLTPWFLKWYGPHLAFGVPGVLMALATLVFWMGRNRFIHIPAGGMRFVEEITKPEGWRTLLKLMPLYLFVAMFWALFDQTQSTWVFQALDMDRNFLGFEWLPSQVQSINSLFVLTFIPLFAYGLYPLIDKVWKLTSLRKISIGLIGMSVAFALVALVQTWIDGGARPNIGWQFVAYALLTAAEVMVSIVALEFAYTQSPRTMKSLVMCFYLGAVAIGNFFTAGVNHYIQIESPSITLEEKLQEATSKGETVEAEVVHAGFDEKLETADDLHMSYATGSGMDLTIPGHEAFQAAAERIEGWAKEHGDTFPRPEDGNALIAEYQDPWGQPLRYVLENSTSCRITSEGPDRKAKTHWDIGVRISHPLPTPEKKKSWTDSLHPEQEWLERRKEELADKLAPTEATTPGEAPASPYKRAFFAGGGTRLEGSSYFWFFTWLMLGTAILFVPYACLYKGKTVLQE